MPDATLIARYKNQLLALLPPGAAMTREPGTQIDSDADAFAVEFARLHEDADTAYDESFPGTATLMLDEWEALCSLPDACSADATTNEERRAHIMERFAIDLGQSETDFRAIATARGYVNTGMHVYETSRCGVMRCGHTPTHNDPWLFASRFNYEAFTSDTVSGTLNGTWSYESSTSSPPANKQVRFDFTAPGSITKLWIDYDNQASEDKSAVMALIADDTFIRFTWDTNPAKWIQFQVNGATTDQGGWYKIDVDNMTSSTSFAFPPDGQLLKFQSDVSSESSVKNDGLECALNRHKHAHTHINFNGWNPSPVAAVSSVRHHFVHGEFDTHADGDDTIIDTWNNRQAGDDWVQGATPDGTTAKVTRVEGFASADLNEGTGRGLSGLSVKTVADDATLIVHNDFTLWVVVHIDSRTAASESILGGGSEFGLRHITGNAIELEVGGSARSSAAGIGATYVITAAANATDNYIKVNDNITGSGPMSGPYANSALALGFAFEGKVLEMIASDYVGVPGINATVDAVSDYLKAKYGV